MYVSIDSSLIIVHDRYSVYILYISSGWHAIIAPTRQSKQLPVHVHAMAFIFTCNEIETLTVISATDKHSE